MSDVDLPSPQHLPEAYVPPELDAEGEDDWPPAIREIAIEQARHMRLEEGGLPIDDATLARVADAVMDPDYPVPGAYFTPEELADDERVEEARSVPWGVVVDAAQELAVQDRVNQRDDDLFRAVDDYLRGHPEINGGSRLGWRDGRRTLFVGLVGDAEAHKAPLLEFGGGQVVFERVPRTVIELEAVRERLRAGWKLLEAAGFQPLVTTTDRARGVVDVDLVGGSDAAAAESYFASQYGDAVAVRWLGPSRHREVLHPFGSWTSQGRVIRVFFGLDHNGQRPGNARVEQQSSERIVIALSCLQPLGVTTLIGGFQPQYADLELREPVGGRAVIDASAGVPRPSLAELRNA
jgi:hypothetical protein